MVIECLICLETETRLQANGSRSEGSLSLAEIDQGDVVRDAGWVEVQIVEEVEDIGADLKLRVFAQNWKLR